jgi:crotonobetainyl-CoA:carnitine CoA-transferase CaiB-like acyl-CoA transferase
MSETPSPTATGPLAGLRVLDFGRYIAGPFCATLLADMGAEVIRVERRDGSEDRYVQPIVPGAAPGEGGEGSMFLQMNRNKKSVTLDPMHPQGRDVVKKLVRTADVVVANLPPATLTRMGLDLDSLRAERKDVILTTVSGFGRGGPDSEKTGFDGVFQAMSGAAHLSGFGDAPVKSYAAWVDFGTAAFAALGTMAALMERGKSGKGQMVEGALLGTALTYFNFHLIEQQLRGTDRAPSGNRSQYAGPADAIQTKDGWIFVQVLGTPLFKRWAKLMGEDHWLEDERFKDDLARGDNGEILSARTAEWAATRTTEQALAELETARIPAGPVLKPADVLTHRHVNEAGFFTPVEFPGMPGPAPVAGFPVKLSESNVGLHMRPPLLGEHTDDVLGSLGYSATDISALREAGAI